MTTITPLSVALALTLSISAPASHAANANAAKAQAAATSYSATLTPRQRGQAISTFVRKWGPYVENTYGTDVHTWSQRMVSTFAKGDAVNIQRALARTTFDGAIAELQGGGHKMSDEEVITKLAQLSNASLASGVTPDALGDLTNDLVYTPITPCRIVDTRQAGGVISAGSFRDFSSYGDANYTAQGGSATNCGMQTESPEALVLNVTAVLPTAAGFATVYPANTARPVTASINYVAGAIVNNTVVTPTEMYFTDDFRIYTLRQSHYVVDIVGYFDAPHATALDCINHTASTTTTTAKDVSLNAATCPASYRAVSVNCSTTGTGSEGVSQVESYLRNVTGGTTTGGLCRWGNTGGLSRTYDAYSTCCRVPGR